jgi:tetratricopeptide (TPR) repeat protein
MILNIYDYSRRLMEGTNSSPWWRKDPSVFAALVALAALAFTATYFISKSYGRRQDSLARHWLQQGDSDLKAAQSQTAIGDYRTALLYSHDNPVYRLRLAQALAANGQTAQAIAYFLSLLDEQPGNGLYNLELARLYSRQGDARNAARYYNAAIYGAWGTDAALARRGARAEFIQFLLNRNAPTQAQAEAIILATGVAPNEISARFLAAKILLATGAYDRAIDEYSSLIKNDAVPAALGAGEAAFQSGKFQSAMRYFNLAVSHGAHDPSILPLLEKSKQVLDVDPNRRRINSAERGRRVIQAYETAGERLQACAKSKGQQLDTPTPATDLQKLYREWSATNSNLTAKSLRDDPDSTDSIMDLVSRIEQTTAQSCGLANGPDWALLMLARYGEGVEH